MDKNCRAVPYLVGRAAAILAFYAGDKFGPGTLVKLLSTPAYYIGVFARYVPAEDTNWQEVQQTEWPKTLKPIEQGQAWIGYYHQKSHLCNYREKIGAQLRTIREERGLSTRALGERCNLAHSHIVRIEGGKYNVQLDTLSAIAEALDSEIKIEKR